MSPLLLLGAAAGAYFLFFKKSAPPVAATSFARDATTGNQFAAQAVGNGTADVFLMPSGARIVRFDLETKREIISPPGVDPQIKAAAIRAFGILPKG